MAQRQRRVYVYTYHGKCLFAWIVTPIMKLVALFCQVKFKKEPGAWLRLTIPKIRIEKRSCDS